MTEKRLREIFDQWQQILGLSHWHIQINILTFEPSTNCMQVARSANYNRATVEVQEWVLTGEKPADCEPGREFTEYEVHRNVCHELLHCALRDIKLSSYSLEEQINPPVWSIFGDVIDNAEERVVDALATALVKAWHCE